MHEDFYQMYLEELEGVAEAGPEEELALLERLAAGEAEAAGRLIEGNLKRVLAYAREYEGKGLPMNDLVQEANMALTALAAEWARPVSYTHLVQVPGKNVPQAHKRAGGHCGGVPGRRAEGLEPLPDPESPG